jgi:hypothetical protein
MSDTDLKGKDSTGKSIAEIEKEQAKAKEIFEEMLKKV